MKTFKAIIETPRRGVITKEIEAEDIEQAKRVARGMGKIISVKKVIRFRTLESPLSLSERQIFLQRLAAMQQSKVGAGEALALMEATFDGGIKRVSGRMLKQIESGADIGQAMERIGAPHFPNNVVALVRSGSKGGDTASALRNASEFEAEMERIKKDSGNGIWSGLVGFASAAGIIFGTTRYMGPQVMESDLIKLAGDKVDVGWAQTLGSVSEWIMGIMSLIMVLLYLLNAIGRRVSPKQADKIILKIPFYKDLVLSRNNYSTLYGLSLLVGSGVPMEQALSLSANASPKGSMQEDLKAAARNVKEGKPWASAMSNLHATDRAALSSSMDRESVANSLNALSKQYKSIYGQRVAALAPILQGIAVIFLCIAGAVLFGLTMVPMMQFATAGTSL